MQVDRKLAEGKSDAKLINFEEVDESDKEDDSVQDGKSIKVESSDNEEGQDSAELFSAKEEIDRLNQIIRNLKIEIAEKEEVSLLKNRALIEEKRELTERVKVLEDGNKSGQRSRKRRLEMAMLG